MNRQKNQHLNHTLSCGVFSNGGYGRFLGSDWFEIGIGDAFNQNIDNGVRVAAQRQFYNLMRKSQLAAARLSCLGETTSDDLKVRPQLGPCYTDYPSSLASYAAIGLTAFLEFRQAMTGSVLTEALKARVLEHFGLEQGDINSDQLKLFKMIANTVETRLLLEDLSRAPDLQAVEIYRLFSASLIGYQFGSLPEITRAVVLFGDVLAMWDRPALHPITSKIGLELTDISRTFQGQLSQLESADMVALGCDWVERLYQCLKPYLELQANQYSADTDQSDKNRTGQSERNQLRLPPLNIAVAPAPLDTLDPAERISQAYLDFRSEPMRKLDAVREYLGQKSSGEDFLDTVKNFREAVTNALKQESEFEDMRSDLVFFSLTRSIFEEGPIEGSPTEGHEVVLALGDLGLARGEVFDRPVPLSDNDGRVQQLLNDANPLSEQLSRMLYPDLEDVVIPKQFCSSGIIDPDRLAMNGFSQSIFKRHSRHQRSSKNGRPVLLIACDGSGSLSCQQMTTVKLLMTAWLKSTSRTDVSILAGLYTSDIVRDGFESTMIKWVHHPRKSAGTNQEEAVRAVANLPNNGIGCQQDALSLAFMMEEAVKWANGRQIYLIHITDCMWNRSFLGRRSGFEEMEALYSEWSETLGTQLNSTIVALGVDDETGLERLVNKVVCLSSDQLENPMEVAEQIGVYVASIIRDNMNPRVKK